MATGLSALVVALDGLVESQLPPAYVVTDVLHEIAVELRTTMFCNTV